MGGGGKVLPFVLLGNIMMIRSSFESEDGPQYEMCVSDG